MIRGTSTASRWRNGVSSTLVILVVGASGGGVRVVGRPVRVVVGDGVLGPVGAQPGEQVGDVGRRVVVVHVVGNDGNVAIHLVHHVDVVLVAVRRVVLDLDVGEVDGETTDIVVGTVVEDRRRFFGLRLVVDRHEAEVFRPGVVVGGRRCGGGHPQDGLVDRRLVTDPTGRDHDRHRAGRRREVDELVGLVDRRHLGDHVDGDEAGPFEGLDQPLPPVHEVLELLAGQLPPAGQLAEHTLAVGPCLLDHLPALLLGHRPFGLGVGQGVAAPARRFEVGLLALALGLLGGLAQQSRGAFLGLGADRGGALAGGGEDARRLLAEQLGHRVVVDHRLRRRALLGVAQLALEEALALLQAGQLGGDHAQEVTDLLLVEAAPASVEHRFRHGRRR